MTLEARGERVRILINGALFAEYRADADRQPAVWPIIGPAGLPMTRSWPVGPREPGEAVDHPHHVSLWFAHGGVNGADFWHDPSDGGDASNRIVHREFTVAEAVDGRAIVATRNDWMSGERRVLADERTLVFGVESSDSPSDRPARWIDFTIRLHAADEPADFAETKEGTFAVRVAETMKIDAKLGGRVLDSRARRDDDAWGRAAEWVDYSGPLAPPVGEGVPPVGGITIITHPQSFRAPCKWHVRSYGLFGANPFGQEEFPASDDPAQGPATLRRGESIVLRHRVVLHDGMLDADDARRWWESFAAEPLHPPARSAPSTEKP